MVLATALARESMAFELLTYDDLLRGTNTVLAVNSYVTNVNCSGVGYSARVDIPEVLDWINTFMP